MRASRGYLSRVRYAVKTLLFASCLWCWACVAPPPEKQVAPPESAAPRRALTPLEEGFVKAAASRKLDEVKSAIERGCDPNVRFSDGFTALMFAVRNNDVKMVSFLLEHGAEVNVANDQEFAPLHFAALFASREVAEHLIKAGADIKAKNGDGSTATSVALHALNRAKKQGALSEIAERAAVHEYLNGLGK